jgi:O-succinylbenzoate synthase
MPTLSAIKSSARIVSIPLRTKFRGLTERELLVFEGPNGWTEWSAFNEYQDQEASVWLSAAIEWGFGKLPEPVRTKIPVNAILPAVPIDQIEKILNRSGGFQSVKIKVAEPGHDLELDLRRIEKVAELYPGRKIKIDANGGYSPSQALSLLLSLREAGVALEYFEQPCQSVPELSELRLEIQKEGLSVMIAADESVRKATDPLAVVAAQAADLVVLKAASLGGVNRALEIAEQCGVDVVSSSALQSSIGLAMELHFAASLPVLSHDSGLGTLNLFWGDLTKDSLRPENGVLELRRPEMNLGSLDTLRAEDHRGDWWIARLERCARILGLQP